MLANIAIEIPPFSIGSIHRRNPGTNFPASGLLVETGVQQLAQEKLDRPIFRGELLKFLGCEIRRALCYLNVPEKNRSKMFGMKLWFDDE